MSTKDTAPIMFAGKPVTDMTRSDLKTMDALLYVVNYLNNDRYPTAQAVAVGIRNHALNVFAGEIMLMDEGVFGIAELSDGIVTERERLTTNEFAALFYSRYVLNRGMRRADIEALGAKMAAGEWNPDEYSNRIGFCNRGVRKNVLFDGHHRIIALIVYGGVGEVATTFVFNVAEKDTHHTDSQRQRTAAQAISMRRLDAPDAGQIEQFAIRRRSIQNAETRNTKLDWMSVSRDKKEAWITEDIPLYRSLEREIGEIIGEHGTKISREMLLKKPLTLAIYDRLKVKVGASKARAIIQNIHEAQTMADLDPILQAVYTRLMSSSGARGNARSVFAAELLLMAAPRFGKSKTANVRLPTIAHSHPLSYFAMR